MISDIAHNIAHVRSRIRDAAMASGHDPDAVCLLAASKRQPVDKIREAIRAGADAVGENRVQEMLQKADAYAGAPLHFIGRLQKNKIKSVVGRAALIHSVEDIEQAACIARRAEALGIVQEALLQVNIGYEPTKGGFRPEAVRDALKCLLNSPGLRVRGLMCIPPAADPEIAEKFFLKMHQLYVDITPDIEDNRGSHTGDGVPILSMGMSGDYAQAVACGSTLVRVGSAIFGARE